MRQLALYYKRSPDRLNDEQIHTWLHHLIVKRRLSGSALNIAVNAVRAFLHMVLGRDPAGIAQGVPRGKRAITRALVYAISEVTALLTALARLRDRALLAVTYACGLRLSKLIAVRLGDLDSARGQHLLSRGFTKIRHYGLLANHARSRLIAQARAALARRARPARVRATARSRATALSPLWRHAPARARTAPARWPLHRRPVRPRRPGRGDLRGHSRPAMNTRSRLVHSSRCRGRTPRPGAALSPFLAILMRACQRDPQTASPSRPHEPGMAGDRFAVAGHSRPTAPRDRHRRTFALYFKAPPPRLLRPTTK